MLSIGLMSGTSMDGIDAALIETDGKGQVREIADASLEYDPAFKKALRAAEKAVRDAKGELELAKKNQAINFDEVVKHSTELHATLVKDLLALAGLTADKIEVIGYHGQTLFHSPLLKKTIQVGEGKYLAELTGIKVINQFREQDIQAGGQGAPFAPLYHQVLVTRDKKIPAAIVNCGGIANITVVSSNTPHDLIGFDTGPGNGLIDRYVQSATQGLQQMDVNGDYGKKGLVNKDILALLYKKAVMIGQTNFFDLPPPKSLDIGDLKLIPELAELSLADACRTLEAFTADSIVESLKYIPGDIPTHWILAGGGWHNCVIKEELQARLHCKLHDNLIIQTADEAGWNGRALEAQLFAYLAVRSLLKLPLSYPCTTRVPTPMLGGVLHI